MVAIHGPEATHHRDDSSDARLLDRRLHPGEIGAAAGGRGVSSVGDRVDHHGVSSEAATTGGIQDRFEMLEIAVDLTIAHQSEHVHPAARLFGVGEGVEQRRSFEELARTHRVGDPHQFLIDDSAGAEILMTDLRIPHDRSPTSHGEPDVLAAGLDQGGRPG